MNPLLPEFLSKKNGNVALAGGVTKADSGGTPAPEASG
jgi:hypothetical protein